MKMNTKKVVSRGFTLIELLVVIAIIGILSAIVLTNLSSARYKGQYSSMQSNLDSLRTEAASYQNTNNYYSGSSAASTTAYSGTAPSSGCGSTGMFSDPVITNMLTSIQNDGITAATCVAGPSTFEVSATNAVGSWCVDWTGASTSTSGDKTNGHC